MNNDPEPDELPDESTGLPVLASWRAVYLVVLGTFLLWLVLLTALTRAFS